MGKASRFDHRQRGKQLRAEPVVHVLHDALALLAQHALTLEASQPIVVALEFAFALAHRRFEYVGGLFGLADVVRPAARDAIELLRRHGVGRVVMLTGDAEGTARAVAREVGVDDCLAGLLPEEKVAAVEALKRRYGVTAMVGDGVNDAPALAAADVGVVMGAAGSDAAIETADVALMADELTKIPFALRLSRATVANIKTNIALSIGIKAVFLSLAVAGAATLWMAVVADVGASLLVIGNGLRLLRAR